LYNRRKRRLIIDVQKKHSTYSISCQTIKLNHYHEMQLEIAGA